MSKDNWDKFDILFKSFVIGLIPIVIGVAASNVADSLKRGQLIQSLVATLSERDSKRDISLVALNEAIQVKKKCFLYFFACKPDTDNDPVSQIAVLLIRSSIEEAKDKNQQPRELAVAKHILTKSDRADLNFYNREFGFLGNSAQAKARSSVTGAAESPERASESATISQTLIALAPTPASQPQSLEGIKLVFIQYENQEELARKIQKSLNEDKVSAPGIEEVKGISKPSIRYSGPADLAAAQSLQKYLEARIGIKISDLIDLSQAGYRVPRGQLEVWVK
jgi:hypothetical protein